MSAILSKLGAWFWYLLPANPILVRVVYGNSRRSRHLWLRFAYLAIILAVVMVGLISSSTTGSLAQLAKGASRTFWLASVTQLLLMCFLAPIFTAGAITQEKDAQTYNILISTPLSNAQIVIGSLMSRLYFVFVLLLAALPIFFTTMIYGGVTTGQIVRSFALAGATALITGSLAITISMVRVGTRKTIFSFFIAIAVYLFTLYVLGDWNETWVAEAPLSPQGRRMSWLAAFHPYLALQVALNQLEAPDIAAVTQYGWPNRYFLAYPHLSYTVLMTLLSFMLIAVSIFFVRRGVREGEITLFSRVAEALRLKRSGQTRTPHTVWSNPVAWREAVTRASALSRGIGRYLVVGCGLLAAIVLLVYYLKQLSGFNASMARTWLSSIVAIEFGLILIIAANTAASALTREKESKTMDILLTTPLTSDYLIWGKLRGLVSFLIPLIAIPTLSLMIFAISDLVRGNKSPVVPIETGIQIGALLTIFSAYACLVGLHFSLKQRKTVRAVMLTVGVLTVANLAIFLFWRSICESVKVVGAALASATPFTAIRVLINPLLLFESPQELAGQYGAFRVAALVGSIAFLFIHGAIVFTWYKSMVKSFDMVIRKQSGQF